MQLKLRRSQRDAGIVSKHAVFMLDARVQFTQDEQRCIQRYKLGGQVIYDSQARNQLMERSADARAQGGRPIDYSGEVGSMLTSGAASLASGAFSGAKSLAFAALASMKLRITINSLQQGHHIECKSLDELLGAEEAIREACQNLRVYLDTAATFNGSEILIDYSRDEPEIIAKAIAPQPALITDAAATVSQQPTPVKEPQLRNIEEASYEDIPPPSTPAEPPVPAYEVVNTNSGTYLKFERSENQPPILDEEAKRILAIGLAVILGVLLTVYIAQLSTVLLLIWLVVAFFAGRYLIKTFGR